MFGRKYSGETLHPTFPQDDSNVSFKTNKILCFKLWPSRLWHMLTDFLIEEVPPKRRQPHVEVQSAIRQFTAVKTSTPEIQCMI
jgi:hypothetical protein